MLYILFCHLLWFKWNKNIFEINKQVYGTDCTKALSYICWNTKENDILHLAAFYWQCNIRVLGKRVGEAKRISLNMAGTEARSVLFKYITGFRNWELSNRANDYSNIFREQDLVGSKFVWYSLLTLHVTPDPVSVRRRVRGQSTQPVSGPCLPAL